MSQTTRIKTAVFDSSGLISLVKDDDELYAAANKIAEYIDENGWLLILSYEVLAETLNTLGRHVSRQFAITVGEQMLKLHDLGVLRLAQTEPYIAKNALETLKTSTGNPSYVDCIVMALANEHNTKYIFGFDATFKKNGYLLPG